MTQAALATAAGLPRPNLSAIERGNREVTLKTLRALAVALNIRPGVLADGCPPNGEAPALTRASMERIADAAAGRPGRHLAVVTPREASLARNLGIVMASRLPSSSRRRTPRRGSGQAEARAYLFLRATETSQTIASLIERTAGRLGRE